MYHVSNVICRLVINEEERPFEVCLAIHHVNNNRVLLPIRNNRHNFIHLKPLVVSCSVVVISTRSENSLRHLSSQCIRSSVFEGLQWCSVRIRCHESPTRSLQAGINLSEVVIICIPKVNYAGPPFCHVVPVVLMVIIAQTSMIMKAPEKCIVSTVAASLFVDYCPYEEQLRKKDQHHKVMFKSYLAVDFSQMS